MCIIRVNFKLLKGFRHLNIKNNYLISRLPLLNLPGTMSDTMYEGRENKNYGPQF